MISRGLTERTVVLILLFSLFALVISFGYEYLGNVAPCKFCLYERNALIASLIIALFWYIPALKTPTSLLLNGSMLFLFLFAITHALIQAGLFVDLCEVPKITNIQDFHSLILKSPPKCSDISLRFFGIPATWYLTILSLALMVLSFIDFLKKPMVRIRRVGKFDASSLANDNHQGN